jgi:hypothetical protein
LYSNWKRLQFDSGYTLYSDVGEVADASRRLQFQTHSSAEVILKKGLADKRVISSRCNNWKS